MTDACDIVVLDIETTGLDVVAGAIVEIAATRHRLDPSGLALDPLATWQTLVQPRVPIEKEAFDIHGIRHEQAMCEGLEPRRALDELLGFASDAPLVAHNGVAFDYLFLAYELDRHGLELPESRLLDSLPLARRYLSAPAYNLAALCEAHGIVNRQAHRALADVEATAQIFALIAAKEHDVDALWRASHRYTMRELLRLPAGFELLDQALRQGRKVQMEYAGANRPARVRWVLPRSLDVTRAGHRSVRALCLESGTEKHFRLDRVMRLIALG